MKWRETTLGSAIHVKHGFAFKSEHFADAGGPIVLTPGNFNECGGFCVRPEKERYYTGDIPEGYVLNEGDLIVAMTEQGAGLLGSSALIPEDGRFLHNQRLGLIDQIDEKILEKRFLYLLFNTHLVRGQISGSASGTKVRHTSPERIYRVSVRIPDITAQRRIVDIALAYDDLIENNRRRIQLLEQSARLLYKEWFVHLRFPGHEHVKLTAGVPKGWHPLFFPDAVEINPTEKVTKGSAIRYLPMTCLSEAGMSIDLRAAEIRDKGTSVRFRNGDTLFARITPCLENGKTGFVDFLNADEVACGSTEFIILRGRRVSPYFVYCLSRTHDFRENAIKSMIGSSGRQRVQESCFIEFKLGLPPASLLSQFDEFAGRCFEQIGNLQRQNAKLTAARDLLLPRLMSGQLVA